MKRFLLAIIGTALIAAVTFTGVSVAPAEADPKPKVEICHHTHSQTNPWVLIKISVNGQNGHYDWGSGHFKPPNHIQDFFVTEDKPCPPVTPTPTPTTTPQATPTPTPIITPSPTTTPIPTVTPTPIVTPTPSTTDSVVPSPTTTHTATSVTQLPTSLPVTGGAP